MQTSNHLAILEQYRQTQTGDGWHTAPDDGYLYDNLALHLREAGLIDELRALFANDNWLHARSRQKGYDAFLSDLQVAWEISYWEALRQIDAGQEFTAFLACMHLAMVETSLRGWAESRTPSIVARAVEIGIWSSEQALSLASLIPDEQRRAVMYAALAKTEKLTSVQTDEAKTQALDAAKNIEYTWSRASTLSMLSNQTEAEQQHEAIAAALDAGLESADGRYGFMGSTLWQLVEKLPDDLIDRALTGVLALKNQEAKVWALSALTKRVPEDRRYELLEKGLEAALQIRDKDVVVANALAQLADQLSGDLVIRALDAALALKEGDWRPRAVVGLMDKLDEGQVKRILENMLTISDEWWRADGLMRVVEHSSGDTQHRALATLLATEHGETVGKIQGWLDYFGTPELINTAIEVARRLDESDHRTRTMKWLQGILDVKTKEAEIESLSDLQSQAEAFLAEAEQLTGEAQSHQIVNAHLSILEIEDEAAKNQLMERLISIAGYGQQGSAEADDEDLNRVLQNECEEERSQELARIAKRLPQKLIPKALDVALRLDETLYRDWALNGLAEQLSVDLLLEALEGRFDYNDRSAWTYCLQALAKRVDEPVRFSALKLALDTVLMMDNLWWRIEPLERLLPALEGELAKRAAINLFEVAQRLRRNETTIRAIAIAIKYLEGETRSSALNIVNEAAWAYEDTFQTTSAVLGTDDSTHRDISKWNRIRVIGHLLMHLEGEQNRINLTKAIDLILSIENEAWLKSALTEIMPYLEGDLWGRAVEATLKIESGRTRSEAILSLMDANPPEIYIQPTLDAALAISERGWRADALIAVAKRIEGEERSKILTKAYEDALKETQTWLQIHLFVELAKLGVSDAMERGMQICRAITDDWYRVQILAEFLPFSNDTSNLLGEIRGRMLNQLNVLRSKKRSEFLWYCTDEDMFNSPVISTKRLTVMVIDLMAVHQNWRWA